MSSSQLVFMFFIIIIIVRVFLADQCAAVISANYFAFWLTLFATKSTILAGAST